jgi:putative colanic acid biosynthesis UDP-glucose lipid carrier transferase
METAMLNSSLPQGSLGLADSRSGEHFFTAVAKTLDAAVIVLMLLVPTWVRAEAWPVRYTLALLAAITVFQVIAGILNLYRPWRGESISRQFFRVITVWVATIFLLLLLAYLLKETAGFSRLALTTWFVATPPLMIGWRMLARMALTRWFESSSSTRNVLVWGTGDIASELVRTLQDARNAGLHLVDHVEPTQDREAPAPRQAGEAATDKLAQPELLELQARRGDFSILYIVLGDGLKKHAAIDVIERLSDTTVSVYLVPDYFSTHLFHGRWSNLGGIPLVSVFDTPFWGADGWLKRIEDLALGSAILVLAALPMALIAAAVKLTSRGPILFRQRRYGIDGNEITVFKFRTMTVTEDGPNIRQAQRGDARFTPIGEFLRKYSLDELPQFINVIRGDMSIVGPRPHAVAHNEFYRSKVRGYMLRHKVKPGITGWAQINGWRGETDGLYKMQKRIEYDLWYIRNWSFWLDIRIILLTAVLGFAGPNAY